MKALFYDTNTGLWREYSDPVAILRATESVEVAGVLRIITERTASEGLHAAGFLSYEAAPAFDIHNKVKGAPDGYPLALFGLFKTMSLIPVSEIKNEPENFTVSPFLPELGLSEYAERFLSVKKALSTGDSYQINLTWRMHAVFSGDPLSWFLGLAAHRPGSYLSYWEDDERAICSLSPELFFEKQGTDIVMKPMKGTLLRRFNHEKEDGQTLRDDPKNRAENLMIVDMVRNDIGRVALTGSVSVPSLFDIEIYPTVLQMTSTVQARTGASVPEIVEALFPCASITGAPKISSMELIKDLELSPRGVYTGSMGYIDPGQNCVFNVAIRTLEIDKKSHRVRYGTGGGIVWDSECQGEWEEGMLKTAILKSDRDFYIFESLLLENGQFFLLDRHLARLQKAAAFFGFREGEQNNPGEWNDQLESAASVNATGEWKVRLCVRPGAAATIECQPIVSLDADYTVALAKTPIDSGDPFVMHKTSCRSYIDRALSESNGASDVILINERNELTETTRANIVLQIDGRRFTPPLSSGLLCGVYREELLEAGEIHERVLYPEDVRRAERVFAVNSVRRFIEARPV